MLESTPSPKASPGGLSHEQAALNDRIAEHRRKWRQSGFYTRHREFLEPVLAKERSMTSLWGDLPGAKFAALRERVEFARQRGACLILAGNRGTGKTQLACGIALVLGDDAAREGRQWDCRYYAWPDLLQEVKQSFDRKEGEGNAYEYACTVQALVLDEVHEALTTDFERHRFTRLIDRRYGEQLQTILIANETPATLASRMGASAADRLTEIGAVLECDWPSFRKPLTS